jgi:hypothetical protein
MPPKYHLGSNTAPIHEHSTIGLPDPVEFVQVPINQYEQGVDELLSRRARMILDHIVHDPNLHEKYGHVYALVEYLGSTSGEQFADHCRAAQPSQPTSIACEMAFMARKPAAELKQALLRTRAFVSLLRCTGMRSITAVTLRLDQFTEAGSESGALPAAQAHGAQVRLGAERGEAGVRVRRTARRPKAVPDRAHRGGARAGRPGVRAVRRGVRA